VNVVVSAAEDVVVVRNLFALYMHDMSEFVALDVEDDGAFAVPASVASYWEGADAPERFPFLIRLDDRLAGFALVRRIVADPATFDMGEFFILRKYRGAGIGRTAARHLFDRFAGAWEVRQLPTNTAAQAFWRRVIGDYARGAFTEGQEFFPAYDREFVVQRFRGGHESTKT
jgi:predicted acetyltransferase